MAREFARVKLGIWDDDDFRDLPAAAQHLYFLLLTSPSLTYCGTTDWRPARLSGMAADWSKVDAEAAAYVLAERQYIVIDESTEEALVRSFIRHDGLMAKPRMAVSMVNAHRAVASTVIRGVIVHELGRLYDEEPNLAGWQDVHGKAGAALSLIQRDAIDPAEVAADLQSVCPSVCTAFVANGCSGLQRVCTPPTPAPTPATADLQTSPRKSGDSRDHERDRFEEFWDTYDHKVDRKAAETKWRLALKKPGVTADMLIQAAAAYIAYERDNEGGRYVMGAAKWLLNERWADERVGRPQPETNVQRHLRLAAELADQEIPLRLGGGR